MSSTLVDLNAQKDRAIAKAEEILSRAEQQKRPLSPIEDNLVRQHTKEAVDLNTEIQRIESKSAKSREEIIALRRSIPAPSESHVYSGSERITPKRFLTDYSPAFFAYLRTGKISAGLTEGVSTSGGSAVPFTVDQETVPFAPASKAVRRLATVIPTTTDRSLPQVTALPTATLKAEASSFSASSSTLGQNTLKAYVVGLEWDMSMEFFEDVPLFQATALRDSSLAMETLEEQKFLTGSGTGEPQGILGNIDTGVAAATPDGAGNLLSIDATWEVLSTLKDDYHNNASWLMQRTTALAIRRAQIQANYYQPVFRRENGVDLLHDYPVNYSASMPSVAAGNTPAIFGDVRAAYIIGDRFGSAVRMKVVNQDRTKIVNGVYSVFIYRRTDGRVRIPEALKALTLHT
jgi:HK97 family phage major capsid protein